MHKNVLFRGCTRPAMFFGVPTVPFFLVAGGCLIGAMYSGNVWKPGMVLFLIMLPVSLFIMRMMASRDEMIFRLVWLNILFKMKARNMREHGGMKVFSPHVHRLYQSPGKPRNMKGPFVITGKLTKQKT
jgi:type IV secretion system protein VirB3